MIPTSEAATAVATLIKERDEALAELERVKAVAAEAWAVLKSFEESEDCIDYRVIKKIEQALNHAREKGLL